MTMIFVVGMPRSGTTYVQNLLAEISGCAKEVEPHLLWKMASLSQLGDEDTIYANSDVDFIKSYFNKKPGSTVIEKSPPNTVRPRLLFNVCPNAKVVYVKRNLKSMIWSTYQRSLRNESFSISNLMKKYFFRRELPSHKITEFEKHQDAIGGTSAWEQIRVSKTPQLIIYILRMMRLKLLLPFMPFGTKLNNMEEIVLRNGLLYYHLHVAKLSMKQELIYRDLFGDNFININYEDFVSNPDEVMRVSSLCGLIVDKEKLASIIESSSKYHGATNVICPEWEKRYDDFLGREFECLRNF